MSRPCTRNSGPGRCQFNIILLTACRRIAALILILARLLYPKLRKRSGRLGGKGAPGSARAAVLNYLSQLDPAELGPIAELFLQSLSGAFREDAPAAEEQPAPDPYADVR